MPDIGEYSTLSIRGGKLDRESPRRIAGATTGSHETLEGGASLNRLDSLTIDGEAPHTHGSKRHAVA